MTSKTTLLANGNALIAAIRHGSYGPVKDLLKQGVDPNYRDRKGATALHYAVLQEPPDRTSFLIMREILRAGANCYVKDKQGRTPSDWLALILEGQDPRSRTEKSSLNSSKLRDGYYKKWAILFVCHEIFPRTCRLPKSKSSPVDNETEEPEIDWSQAVRASKERHRELKKAVKRCLTTLNWARRFLRASI